MFLLAELKDTIRIPPEMFQMRLIDAVKDEINRKLANKVSTNEPKTILHHFSIAKQKSNFKYFRFC